MSAGRDAGLHVECGGRGRPVVFIHSSGLSGRQWRSLAEALAADHQAIVPDLFGYGRSMQPDDPSAITTADDVGPLRRLLAGVGRPVSLVGHSYGGFLALLLAAELSRVDPKAVRAVAVYEPVAFGSLAESSALGLPAAPELDEYVLATPEETFFDLADGGYEGWLRRFVGWWNGRGVRGTRCSPPCRLRFALRKKRRMRKSERSASTARPSKRIGRSKPRPFFCMGLRPRT